MSGECLTPSRWSESSSRWWWQQGEIGGCQRTRRLVPGPEMNLTWLRVCVCWGISCGDITESLSDAAEFLTNYGKHMHTVRKVQ